MSQNKGCQSRFNPIFTWFHLRTIIVSIGFDSKIERDKFKFVLKLSFKKNLKFFKAPEDESLVKLARFLNDKRMTLIEMFRVLDSDYKSNQNQMYKSEFKRRIKVLFSKKFWLI